MQEIPLERRHPNRRLLEDVDRNLHILRERPHLIMWGLQDPVFHRAFLAGWRQRFPAAEVDEIEDASHWVVDEAPERVLARVREFLLRTA